MHYNYLVVGTGLFSSVFAYEMNKLGKKCLMIDKRNHIGGNLYTEEIENIQVHKYGAHIFHTSNKEVWNYIQQFAEFNHYINSPVAVYKEDIYNLPFNMNTFSRLWGIKSPQEAKAIIQMQIRECGITEPQNLEEQAISLVGKDVYELLIKGYTEKQWGRPCNELPSFIIKRLPLRFTYDNNYFNDPYQGIPKGGYTPMIAKMLEGIEVRLNCEYKQLVEELGEELQYDKVLYTGMIDEFFDYKLGKLEYRSLRFETETISNKDNFQGNAVVNYTEKEVPYTRIIEHKHFEFGTQPCTVITKEYPAAFTQGSEPYYPINDDSNNQLFAAYQELAAKEEKVLFGGRLGQYKYYDMDKVIEEALKMVQSEIQ